MNDIMKIFEHEEFGKVRTLIIKGSRGLLVKMLQKYLVIFGRFVSLSHAIEDDYNKSHKKLQSKVDGKIQRMIQKHKQELCIRDEHGMTMQ